MDKRKLPQALHNLKKDLVTVKFHKTVITYQAFKSLLAKYLYVSECSKIHSGKSWGIINYA